MESKGLRQAQAERMLLFSLRFGAQEKAGEI